MLPEATGLTMISGVYQTSPAFTFLGYVPGLYLPASEIRPRM